MYRPLTPEKRTILVIAFALLVLSVVKGGYYTITYGGTDLRSISIASKLLDTGNTAYFYRWSPGEPAKYLDPNLPPTTVSNAVTVAPGTLYFMSLFSWLWYPVLRMVWTTMQYLLIGFILCYFFFQKGNSADRRWAIFVVGGLFFLCTPIWFLNIERGQVYVLFTFFFTLIFLLYRSSSRIANVSAGMLLAIAMYCRPNFALVLVPIILVRNWRVLAGWTGMAVFLVVHAYIHRGLWTGYFAVIHEFSGVQTASETATHPQYSYPAVIEGAKNLTKYKTDFVCGGIRPLGLWLESFLHIGSIYFYAVLLLVILAILVLVFKKEMAKKDATTIFLFGFLLYMMTEYILPTSRSAYSLILWVFPVLLFLQRPRFPRAIFVLLITGLCFINGVPFYFLFIHDLGEALLVFCLLYYLKAPEIKTPPGFAPSFY